jgi:hypothetical protein
LVTTGQLAAQEIGDIGSIDALISAQIDQIFLVGRVWHEIMSSEPN